MKTGINLLPYFEQESEKDKQVKKWLIIFPDSVMREIFLYFLM